MKNILISIILFVLTSNQVFACGPAEIPKFQSLYDLTTILHFNLERRIFLKDLVVEENECVAVTEVTGSDLTTITVPDGYKLFKLSRKAACTTIEGVFVIRSRSEYTPNEPVTQNWKYSPIVAAGGCNSAVAVRPNP